MSKERPYHYFDTPDGEDLLNKLWCVLKIATPVSLGIATTDVMLYSHPKGYFQTLGRYAYITLPMLGIATTFVIVTNIATSVRKKDDKLNWVAGACSAAGVLGTWRKSMGIGFAGCIGFSVAALVKKHAIQEGWILVPEKMPQAHGGLRAVRHDWTLSAYRPGNWVKEAPDSK